VADDRWERRHTALIEAAVRLLGRDGRQAVTHRAVAEEAGVPLGSTTYYFKSRDDLLAQALGHITDRVIEAVDETTERFTAAESAEELADALCEWLVEAVEPGRNRYVAEYELWLEAARRPELRDTARAWCAADRQSVQAALARLGSEDPERDARIVVPAIDGFGGMAVIASNPVKAAEALRPEIRRLVGALLPKA
jgi:DNA-binding transcriptional regulator YbjK